MRAALGAQAGRHEDYLELLEARLGALALLAQGTAADLRLGRSDRAVARRFLAPREGTWHDGDENLVRGWLDRFHDGGAGARAALILDAASALADMRCRPETLWFFLWEMESVLPDL